METKQDLRNEIKKLKEEAKNKEDQTLLIFTKKELQEFIKKEVQDNLVVEVNAGESYKYGGGYQAYKTINVFWNGVEVSESTSFE